MDMQMRMAESARAKRILVWFFLLPLLISAFLIANMMAKKSQDAKVMYKEDIPQHMLYDPTIKEMYDKLPSRKNQ